jgi:phosphoserine phosphatase RsbU/P
MSSRPNAVKILVAEGDSLNRLHLQSLLTGWGYQVELACDGTEALRRLQQDDSPRLVLLDCVLPGIDGVEVCQRVRAQPCASPPYLILLSVRHAKADIVHGLDSGANDYITKPFDDNELQARLHVGKEVVTLQERVACQVRELEDALNQVNQLRGLLPICTHCKKINRDQDQGYWEQVEKYITRHAGVRFSHGICPNCWETEVQPQIDQLKAEGRRQKAE